MAPTTEPRPEAASQRLESQIQKEAVTLPANVTIYNGPSSSNLLQASVFTRLATTVKDHAQLANALGSEFTAFSHQHHNIVFIFDNDQDTHHEHFREVCLKLRDHDFGLEYGRCVFDANSALQAGFQLDELNKESVLVIDLQYKENDEDDEDDDDSDFETLDELVGKTS